MTRIGRIKADLKAKRDRGKGKGNDKSGSFGSAAVEMTNPMNFLRQSHTVTIQPDNLLSLKDDMVAFIAGHGMRRMNGFVTDDIPSVLFEDDDNPDGWKDFVELGKAANSPFLTMSEFVLEKADIEILLDHLREENFPEQESPEIDEAQYLVNFVGRTGFLQLGFSHQGIMYVYETSTEWYDRFQELMEAIDGFGGGIIVDEGDSED